MSGIGKLLVVFGIVMILVGGLVLLSKQVPWLGRLPGDIHVERGNWTFYFPLATSLIVSVILSLIFFLLSRR
jgi:hypothetical protein